MDNVYPSENFMRIRKATLHWKEAPPSSISNMKEGDDECITFGLTKLSNIGGRGSERLIFKERKRNRITGIAPCNYFIVFILDKEQFWLFCFFLFPWGSISYEPPPPILESLFDPKVMHSSLPSFVSEFGLGSIQPSKYHMLINSSLCL